MECEGLFYAVNTHGWIHTIMPNKSNFLNILYGYSEFKGTDKPQILMIQPLNKGFKSDIRETTMGGGGLHALLSHPYFMARLVFFLIFSRCAAYLAKCSPDVHTTASTHYTTVLCVRGDIINLLKGNPI